MRTTIYAAAIGLALLTAAPVLAADHEVQMLNKDSEGRAMQFEPAFLQVEPGDTVTFVPTDPGHNSQALEDAIPEGAEAWRGAINEEITVTLTEPGLYAYRCMPHFALGMVGLIQVGDDTSNIEAVQEATLPGRAGERMTELLAELEAGGAANAGAAEAPESAPAEEAPAEEVPAEDAPAEDAPAEGDAAPAY
jgi:pseudoazurin